jgi:hypothetical protein
MRRFLFQYRRFILLGILAGLIVGGIVAISDASAGAVYALLVASVGIVIVGVVWQKTMAIRRDEEPDEVDKHARPAFGRHH